MINTIPQDMEKCIEFHGHLCPGITIGYLASRIGMKKMRWRRAADEELICIAMSDGCAVDAIQFLTGCTLGKGNLIFQDYGKMVFVFLRRTSESAGNGIRISLRRSPRRKNTGRSKSLSKEEAALSMLRTPTERLFTAQRVKNYPIPERARVFTSRACAACGEFTMEPRMKVREGKLLCPECYPDEYSRGW